MDLRKTEPTKTRKSKQIILIKSNGVNEYLPVAENVILIVCWQRKKKSLLFGGGLEKKVSRTRLGSSVIIRTKRLQT